MKENKGEWRRMEENGEVGGGGGVYQVAPPQEVGAFQGHRQHHLP